VCVFVLDDPPVTCQDKDFATRLDLSPPQNLHCLPKYGSVADDICFNPDEGIVYTFNADPAFVTVNDADEYCLTFINVDPPAPNYCVSCCSKMTHFFRNRSNRMTSFIKKNNDHDAAPTISIVFKGLTCCSTCILSDKHSHVYLDTTNCCV